VKFGHVVFGDTPVNRQTDRKYNRGRRTENLSGCHPIRTIGASTQRRRNGGSDGVARPRNVETTRARVSFRLPQYFPTFLHAVP